MVKISISNKAYAKVFAVPIYVTKKLKESLERKKKRDNTFEIEITSEKGISQSTIETKVKEILMQIGADIEEEKMG